MSTPLEPGLGGFRRAYAALSVLLLAAFVAAWVKDSRSEWRVLQERYNTLAATAGKPVLAVGLRQLWRPELDVVDRCTTCHLAMGGAAALPGEAVFKAHPPTPHEPTKFGCTPCHGGQGRATTTAAAHGGPTPLLDRPYVQAGCGTCHTGLVTQSRALVQKGEELIKDYGCLGCHAAPERADAARAPSAPGVTGTAAAATGSGTPSAAGTLATVGLRGLPAGWHDRHAGLSSNGVTFAPLADDDLPAVVAALGTRVGAPRLMAGKQLVARLGCRGCHRINGEGGDGDDGPNLDEPPTREFSTTAELAAWHRTHLLDPQGPVKNSRMPKLGLTPEQADLVTVYLLSLRTRALPEKLVPRDRARTTLLGERDHPTDPASLFEVYCSACHGPKGEGRTFAPSPQAFPAIANPTFLALADDEFLKRTIRLGRPGRRMPSWGRHGSLADADLDALAAFVRAFEPPAPPAFSGDALSAPFDLATGRKVFAEHCAPCHGPAGEGSDLAPPLAAKDNEVTAADDRIHGTLSAGVAGTAMGAFRTLSPLQLRSVIAAVRELPRLEVSRKAWKVRAGDPVRGQALFGEHCVKCHEPEAGKTEAKGPGIQLPAFLSIATDGYLAGTIIRGRPGTEMPTFGQVGKENARLTPEQVGDVVAFLRSKAPVVKGRDGGTP